MRSGGDAFPARPVSALAGADIAVNSAAATRTDLVSNNSGLPQGTPLMAKFIPVNDELMKCAHRFVQAYHHLRGWLSRRAVRIV